MSTFAQIVLKIMRKIFAMIMMLSLMMASACREKLVPVEPEKPEQEEQTPTPGPGEDEKDPIEEPGDGSGEEPGVEPEPDVLMVFNVSVSEPSSANNDDIALLDELHYALYSNEAENISYALSEDAQPIVRDVLNVAEGAAKVEVSLAAGAAGHEFVLILWAQKFREEGQEFYDLTDLRNIKCAGDVVLCNQEERVAYYLTHKFTPEGAEHAENLTLVRPHARLNLGTFAQSLRRPDGSTLRLDQSSISLTGVSTSFNTIAGLDRPHATSYGAAGDSTSEKFTFQMNDVPQKAIIINEIEYPYLALNYFFLADRVDLDFEIFGTPMAPESGEQQLSNEAPDDETSEDDQPRQATFQGSLYGVNAHQGYTTTLIGHFFGADGRYEYDFRLQIGEDPKGGVTIIGDEDGDGQYDEPMDWGWALGGDDTPSGGGIGGGNGDLPGVGGGDDEDQGGKDEGEQKEDVRIETPDAVTWEVYTREGLMMWANEVRASTTEQRINLKLFKDIYLDPENNWIPVTVAHKTNYYGSIDGQGHSIYNLTIESYADKVGFLACTNQDDEIQVANLNFYNVNIVGGSRVGVIAGKGEGLYNCHVMSGTVQGQEYVGGLLGSLIGNNSSAPRNCSNYAKVSGGSSVGGIVGYEDSGVHVIVYDCINYGDVEASGDYAGGICSGSGSLYPSGCENRGTVKGVNFVGGITGRTLSTGSARDCINYGDVFGNTYVGGIAGYDDANNCINYGNVTGVTYVGGISGLLDGNFATECTNYGVVIGESIVGGVAGYAKTQYAPTLSSHSNFGDVYGITKVGGVLGAFRSSGGNRKVPTINGFVNEGNVFGKDEVGGILGCFQLDGNSGIMNLSNSRSSGTITGVSNVGQLVGLNRGTINDDGTNIFSGEVVIVEAEE